MALLNVPPPSNDKTEMAILAQVICDPGTLNDVGFLDPGHFIDPVLGKIWGVLVALILSGQASDVQALRRHFEHLPDLEEVGGTAFIGQLAHHDVPADIRAAATEVRDCWVRRNLITFYRSQQRDAEENTLAAHGLTDRRSGEALAVEAAMRCAEYFALFKGLLGAVPPVLIGGVADVTKLAILMPLEIRELAHSHEVLGAADDTAGDHHRGDARRARAEQLREMIGEAAP